MLKPFIISWNIILSKLIEQLQRFLRMIMTQYQQPRRIFYWVFIQWKSFCWAYPCEGLLRVHFRFDWKDCIISIKKYGFFWEANSISLFQCKHRTQIPYCSCKSSCFSKKPQNDDYLFKQLFLPNTKFHQNFSSLYQLKFYNLLNKILLSMQSSIFVYEDDEIIIDSRHHIDSYQIFSMHQTSYLFCKTKNQMKEYSLSLRTQELSYSCELSKELNTEYKSSLNELIRHIASQDRFEVEKCWFGLYLISNFSFKTSKSYKPNNPIYGEEVIVNRKGSKQNRVTSNCFKQNKSYYYFVNSQDSLQSDLMPLVLDASQNSIYGFQVKIGSFHLCLPLAEILEIASTSFLIDSSIQEKIKDVVYVNYDSSYCTGLLYSKNRILTVRHLFSTLQPIGTVVNIRLYPYDQERTAKLVLLSVAYIDLIVLQLINVEEMSNEIIIPIQPHKQFTPELHLGMNIFAIGFGKYSFQHYKFKQINLLLPTVTYGVVSKVITHKGTPVYFKTDSFLYNGYSGCPIWHDQGWLGNSVFIIRNKVSSKKHPRHNFNYSRKFIEQILSKQPQVQQSSPYEQFFIDFQKIHTRKQLKIVAKL